MSELFRRYGTGVTYIAVGLTAFWLLILVILPYAGLFEQSFRLYLPVDQINGPDDHYSVHNYLALFSSPQDMTFGIGGLEATIPIPIHLWVFLITIVYSSLATLVVLLICYPIAYCMAKVMPQSQLPTYLLLLVIPLWVSELMRSFAWYIILSLKGPLTIVLQTLGIITDPIHWTWGMAGYSGIFVGLIYT